MSRVIEREEAGIPGLGRRAWLKRAASRSVGLAGISLFPRRARATQDRKLTPAEDSARELERQVPGASAATSLAL